jgi:hypothetical protein
MDNNIFGEFFKNKIPFNLVLQTERTVENVLSFMGNEELYMSNNDKYNLTIDGITRIDEEEVSEEEKEIRSKFETNNLSTLSRSEVDKLNVRLETILNAKSKVKKELEIQLYCTRFAQCLRKLVCGFHKNKNFYNFDMTKKYSIDTKPFDGDAAPTLPIVNVYSHFLKNPKIESGCYNAGFENISIREIAEMIKKEIALLKSKPGNQVKWSRLYSSFLKSSNNQMQKTGGKA